LRKSCKNGLIVSDIFQEVSGFAQIFAKMRTRKFLFLSTVDYSRPKLTISQLLVNLSRLGSFMCTSKHQAQVRSCILTSWWSFGPKKSNNNTEMPKNKSFYLLLIFLAFVMQGNEKVAFYAVCVSGPKLFSQPYKLFICIVYTHVSKMADASSGWPFFFQTPHHRGLMAF
jgi:hypothetical protein